MREFCPFCNWQSQDILEETPNFVLLADRYPLIEGHSLLIPKVKLPCIGAIPAEQQAEFLQLLNRAQTRLSQLYGEIGAWENGGIRQEVKHAHLHLFPLPRQRTLELPRHFWNKNWIIRLENWPHLFEWYNNNGFYQLFQTTTSEPPHILKSIVQEKRYNALSRARLRQIGVWSFIRARVIRRNGPRLRQNLLLKWNNSANDYKRFAGL